jgi:hypothetical protein
MGIDPEDEKVLTKLLYKAKIDALKAGAEMMRAFAKLATEAATGLFEEHELGRQHRQGK